MTSFWMVRAGQGGVSAERWLEGGFIEVAFGAKTLGPRAIGMNKEALVEQLRALLPDRKEAQVLNQAGQLYRFNEDIALGDEVLTYDPEQRRYFVGRVEGGAEFVGEDDEGEAHFRRKVKWTHRADRDVLSIETRNTLGSTLTIFRPNEDAVADLKQRAVPLNGPEMAVPPKPVRKGRDGALLDQIGDAMLQKSRDFIEDRIARLDPYEMQDLVAGILRGMGYKPRVAPPGPDGGHDIFASPDGLGLQEPRIFVEVKHRTGTQMGAPEIRSFLGGRRPGDRCLYVSTGGFTKDARAEALRAAVPITLVDLAQLRGLVE